MGNNRAKTTIKKVTTNLKDSDDAIMIMKKLDKIEDDEFLHTTDAKYMHPNMDIEEGITALLVSFGTYLLKKKRIYQLRNFSGIKTTNSK